MRYAGSAPCLVSMRTNGMLAKLSPLKLAKLAILGSLLVALRFLCGPVAGEPRRRHLYQIEIGFRGFLVIPALIIATRETSIWSSAILGFVAVGIPIILLGLHSWNRCFHPDRLPARWVKHGDERLQNLETVLTLY